MNSIQLLIKEICEEENINFHTISKDWIIVLEKDDQIHYISGSKFDLNNFVSARICNDKYACYEALKYHNIPVCEYHIFYANDPRQDVLDYFNKCNGNVVVKGNTGSFGDNVFHPKDFNELLFNMNTLFKENHSISISPYYNIKNEYRVIVLDNHVELIYGKRKPVVKGDGIHTVYELLLEFNRPFFLELEDHSSLDYVLEKDCIFEYNWQHNLSKGAVPFQINDEELIRKLEMIATRATDKLKLRFVSVDVVELDNNELKVLEINSGVVTNIASYFDDGDAIAKRVYRKAILTMFEK